MNNYSIVIQWSQQDECYVASLPEWSNQNTYGESYEAALANAQQFLTSLIESAQAEGKSLPKASIFQIPSLAK